MLFRSRFCFPVTIGYMFQSKNGYNSNIGIGLVKEDMEELEIHLDKIGVWNKRISDKKKISSWRQTKSLLTNNKRIYNFLMEMDFKEKSYKSADKILNIIPEKLRHYFFRGLIDGDGCFYISKNKKQKQFTISSSIGQDWGYRDWETDRKSTRLNSSHSAKSRMPSSA